MPENIARLLQEIGVAQSEGELTAVAAEIEESDFDEQALEQLADAIRAARERLKAP